MSFWQGNIFNGGANENPLVTAAKGELFVPIGDEDHPPLARWILIGFGLVAAVISVFLYVNRLYSQSITLPERNSSIIGYSIHDVTGVPDTVAYAGLDFAYKVTDFEGIIDGLQYTAKGSVEEVAAVVDSLMKCYGEPDEYDKIALSAVKKEDFVSLGRSTWIWDYGKHSVKSLEKLEAWGSNVAGYEINPTHLYMELIVTAGADGLLDIVICYQVRPEGAVLPVVGIFNNFVPNNLL